MATIVRRPWIGGNWKCNGERHMIELMSKELNKLSFDKSQLDLVICPSALHISLCQSSFDSSKIEVGCQNVANATNGAFTGELSVPMLKDMGVKCTLIGHSERRILYGETDEDVAKKVEFVQKAGLQTVVCIGERLEQRKEDKTAAVITEQCKAFFPKVEDWERVVIAYEPVWAIGTGVVATPEQAQEAHKVIRTLVRSEVGEKTADSIRIVYGGSVNDSNCQELIKLSDVDGFLVGGASLKPPFTKIVESALLLE